MDEWVSVAQPSDSDDNDRATPRSNATTRSTLSRLRIWSKRAIKFASGGAAMAVCVSNERYRITSVMVVMYLITRQAGGSHLLAFQVAMGAARVLLYSSPVFRIARQFMWFTV